MKLNICCLFAILGNLETVSAAIVGSGTYHGHFYEVLDNKLTFDEAVAYAATQVGSCGKNGYLAAVTSSAENDFVYSLIPSGQMPWIGLDDKDVEGQFAWVTGEVYDFNNWRPGSPDNHNGEEHCVHLVAEGEWNDNRCVGPRYGLVIEYPCDDPASFGDPHIKTWTGERYDYHGICDLVLLQNPDFNGVGMDIHIRTKKVQRWSLISSAVLRIGSETLEVMGSGNKYWINGMEGGDLKKGVSGFAILHRVVNRQQEEFRVVLDDAADEAIVLSTFKDMVRVDVKSASSKNYGRSLGLLGTFVGGLKIGRDKETVIEDNNAFGQEWQVLASEEMLFHVAEGPQAPEKCSIPSFETIQRRLKESSFSLEDAEVACSRVSVDDFDSCVFDVLAMNDRDVAGSY
jgi:hypothetical protein